MRTLRALAFLIFPIGLSAQTPGAPSPASPSPTAPQAVERPLAQFAAERLAVTPVQYWRADTTGWSVTADGASLRAQMDSAFGRELRERGMGNRWAFAGDVVRSARRNPTLQGNPSALGAGRWRNTPPVAEEAVPTLVGDNLRMISALGDTRYAMIPLELRGLGDVAVLRIVLVDTRRRIVLLHADLAVAGAEPNTVAEALAKRFADLVVDP